MIAPTPPPTDPIAHQGLANAVKHVKANMARRADNPNARQAERAHVPGANALEHLQANAQRIEAKRSSKIEPEPDKTLQVLDPAPSTGLIDNPLEPGTISPTEPWSTGRFVVTA